MEEGRRWRRRKEEEEEEEEEERRGEDEDEKEEEEQQVEIKPRVPTKRKMPPRTNHVDFNTEMKVANMKT